MHLLWSDNEVSSRDLCLRSIWGQETALECTQGQSGPELSAEIWTLEKSHSQQKGELREQTHLQRGDKQACVFQSENPKFSSQYDMVQNGNLLDRDSLETPWPIH